MSTIEKRFGIFLLDADNDLVGPSKGIYKIPCVDSEGGLRLDQTSDQYLAITSRMENLNKSMPISFGSYVMREVTEAGAIVDAWSEEADDYESDAEQIAAAWKAGYYDEHCPINKANVEIDRDGVTFSLTKFGYFDWEEVVLDDGTKGYAAEEISDLPSNCPTPIERTKDETGKPVNSIICPRSCYASSDAYVMDDDYTPANANAREQATLDAIKKRWNEARRVHGTSNDERMRDQLYVENTKDPNASLYPPEMTPWQTELKNKGPILV
jgi:hypothetical protein